jgi:hypothetical protein
MRLHDYQAATWLSLLHRDRGVGPAQPGRWLSSTSRRDVKQRVAQDELRRNPVRLLDRGHGSRLLTWGFGRRRGRSPRSSISLR